METCGTTTDDETTTLNIITYVHVEGANVYDGKSTIPAIEAAAEVGLKPEVVLADTAYDVNRRVEQGRGGLSLRFPQPPVKPDRRFSRIRLTL
jgi:hypothetical protein